MGCCYCSGSWTLTGEINYDLIGATSRSYAPKTTSIKTRTSGGVATAFVSSTTDILCWYFRNFLTRFKADFWKRDDFHLKTEWPISNWNSLRKYDFLRISTLRNICHSCQYQPLWMWSKTSPYWCYYSASLTANFCFWERKGKSLEKRIFWCRSIR